jgi:hypothetical protein
MWEAASLQVLNVDGLKCFASFKQLFEAYTIVSR